MTVSIALCTYNGERFLCEQLESLRQQTALPFELVVRDDCSTDRTMSILQEFAESAPFPVRISQNEQTLGATQNFARALGDCRGDYIALCDQDDVWLPTKLERIADELMREPVDLLFSDATLIDEAGRSCGKSLWESFGFGARQQAKVAQGKALEVLAQRTFVTGATAVVSRVLCDVALPFPSDLPPPVIHDGWLALIAATRQRIRPVSMSLLSYRTHSTQQAGIPLHEGEPLLMRLLRSPSDRKRWISHHHARLISLGHRTKRLGDLLKQRLGTDGDWQHVWDAAVSHLSMRQQLPTAFVPRAVRIFAATSEYYRFSPAPFFDMRRDLFFPHSK